MGLLEVLVSDVLYAKAKLTAKTKNDYNNYLSEK